MNYFSMSGPLGSWGQLLLSFCLLELLVFVCWYMLCHRKEVSQGKVAKETFERTRIEEQICFMTRFDRRSGLPRQFLFHDRLDQAMLHAARAEEIFAVMRLDLENFKAVVSTLGHEAGEELLQEISRRIIASLREEDTVARCGNDSFLLLFAHLQDVGNAGKIAAKLLKTFRHPVQFENHEIYLAADIGIAVYPVDGNEPRRLLDHAGTALLHAKKQGRNSYQYFTPAMTVRSLARLNLEAGLHRALECEEFVVHYQPQIDLASGAVIGAEALVRWQHPEQGLIPPDEFIMVAEETGMICAIGEVVLHTACHQAQAWRQAGIPLQRVTVNLSARQFQQPDLVLQVEKALRESGLPSHALGLEITETSIMKDHDSAIATLLHLKELGVHIAVDDFGVGSSSLKYIKIFPIDMLKIDRAFVTDIACSSKDRAIVSAVVALGQHLGLQVLAEGVEEVKQWQILQDLGVDEGQGYLFGKPCAGDNFLVGFRFSGVGPSCGAAKSSKFSDQNQQLMMAEGT